MLEKRDDAMVELGKAFVRLAAAKAEQAAPGEPLSPTTEELVDTVTTGMGDSSYVQRADALDALSELARRVKA